MAETPLTTPGRTPAPTRAPAPGTGPGRTPDPASGTAPGATPRTAPGAAPASGATRATPAAPDPGPRPVRVLLVDDHQVVRRGLRTFLEIQDDIAVVGEAADGAEGVARAAALAPDVVLMDLTMPGGDGITALRELRAAGSTARVLVVTSFTESRTVVPALRAGAAGYLYKDIDPDALAHAIRAVHAGQVVLQPEVAAALLTQDEPAAPRGRGGSLTDREREVLALIAEGRSNREIARALVLSEKTVKTHVSNVLMKLDLADRTQAALWAVRHGLGGA